MIGNGDGYCGLKEHFLHDDVASASSNPHEALLLQNRTNLFASEGRAPYPVATSTCVT